MSIDEKIKFDTIQEALVFWAGQDTGPLWTAIKPPLGAAGNETSDAMLAVTFRRMAEAKTLPEQVDILRRAIWSEIEVSDCVRKIFPGTAAPVETGMLDVMMKWHLDLTGLSVWA